MIRERFKPTFIRASAMRIGYVVAGALMGMTAQGTRYVDPWNIWEPTEPAWKLIGEDSDKSQVYIDTKSINQSEMNTPGKIVWAFMQIVYASPRTKLDHDHTSPRLREVHHTEFGCSDMSLRTTNRTVWYENGEKSSSPMPLLFQIPHFPIKPKTVYADILKAVCLPSTADSVAKTKVRMDPEHPLRIGDWYPDASRQLKEEGRCIVRITVAIDGRVAAETLQASSGSPRLDEACLKAFHGERMLPATENGKPVETTLDIPIDWKP